MKYDIKTKELGVLVEAYRPPRKELLVNPEYQRGLQWTMPQKQGLIDSILRGYQIPIFYIHLETQINNYTQSTETKAWIVDGQQRLAAIVDYCQNKFPLPNPNKAKPGTVLPINPATIPAWAGKKFQELDPESRDRLINHKLLIVEMTADRNEVRDLFIRLQAGTPLTAQEKRDAWPGDFTSFVIQHAGKPGHDFSYPKPYFDQFSRKNTKRLTVADGEHYVDGHAEMRKFFAGLAMTVMLRERSDADFVDLKGKTINEFYLGNLDLPSGDPGAERVVRLLDRIVELPKFSDLKEAGPVSFQMAFHFALLVDSLLDGDYTNNWKNSIVGSFLSFKKQVADARLHYKTTRESLPHHEQFGRLLSGSGSDTAEVIRLRHAFMLSQIYPLLDLGIRDPKRLFDSLEREVIWNRDRGQCQNPGCTRPGKQVAFREAEIHHIIEHSAGGQTTLANGVLICPECHSNRAVMQQRVSFFQDYVRRVYAGQVGSVMAPLFEDITGDVADSGAGGRGIRIVIDWGALDVDRPVQTIQKGDDVETIVELLRLLLESFNGSMRDQLTQFPIVRFPLSGDPTVAFLNQKQGKTYGHTRIPGTDLYFCPHSGRAEKIDRLKALFSRLTLPDGSEFPSDCIAVFADDGP